jgi:hypothetical protein
MKAILGAEEKSSASALASCATSSISVDINFLEEKAKRGGRKGLMRNDFRDGCKRLQRLQKLSFLTEFAGALKLICF